MNQHLVSVTPAEPETMWKDGAYTLSCTCGEQVTYRGWSFTRVEADRHSRYHQAQGHYQAEEVA